MLGKCCGHSARPSCSASLSFIYPRRNAVTLSDSVELPEDEDFKNLVQESKILPENSLAQGHRVLVIQPRVKWARIRNIGHTTHELMLQEASALARTLPNWTVVEEKIVNVLNTGKSTMVFGSGNVVELGAVLGRGEFTAAFVNYPMLTGAQHAAIQDAWRIPVFDRHSIVLQIFKTYARTAEARLQIALAEIPYIRARLKTMHEHGNSAEGIKDALSTSQLDQVGGSGSETYWQKRSFLLRKRESHLKKALGKLRGERERQVETRKSDINRVPHISIVGYTNAGKTSLIQAITQDQRCVPRDRLFATLDVTRHSSILPNGLGVMYADTVGFISNLPPHLLSSFHATIHHIHTSVTLPSFNGSNPMCECGTEEKVPS